MRPVRRIASATLAVLVLGCPALAAEQPASPYAGQQVRPIKALSDEDVAALRNGEGMGLAKAAELNGYPGPAHLLALAAPLGLTEDQRHQITAILERMRAAAKALGAEIVAREQSLDQLFAKGDITPDRLPAETAAISALQGRLRAVHLAAHLETRPLLTPGQVALYQQLRGYGGSASSPEHHRRHGQEHGHGRIGHE